MCFKNLFSSFENDNIIEFQALTYENLISQIEKYFDNTYNDKYKIIGNISDKDKSYFIISNNGNGNLHKIKMKFILKKYNNHYKIKIFQNMLHNYSV